MNHFAEMRTRATQWGILRRVTDSVPMSASIPLVRPAGQPPLAIAHRGYSAVAPENTLAAIEAAIRTGAEFVEVDTHATVDGVPVVMHDSTVDRTTDGSGAVAELTAAEIAAFDAGSPFSPVFAGQRVPTLGQVLDHIKGSGTRLLLEVKGGQNAEQVRAIVTEVLDRDMVGEVLVQSFDEDVLRYAREFAPHLSRGLLRGGLIDTDPVATAKALDVVTYNPIATALTIRRRLVPQLNAAGIAVMPWTVNKPKQWAALTELGVDGIITDRVGELVGWRQSR